jgi:hypothetical protein
LASFHLILTSFRHPQSYHPFFDQILAHHLLLVAQSLHHLRLFLQQSIPNLLSNAMFLWAQRILSPLVVMPAAASFANASMMQDQQAVCSP